MAEDQKDEKGTGWSTIAIEKPNDVDFDSVKVDIPLVDSLKDLGPLKGRIQPDQPGKPGGIVLEEQPKITK